MPRSLMKRQTSLQNKKSSRIDITIEAGKTYYIQLIVQNDMWTTNIFCQEVTENSFNRLFPCLREEKNCL